MLLQHFKVTTLWYRRSINDICLHKSLIQFVKCKLAPACTCFLTKYFYQSFPRTEKSYNVSIRTDMTFLRSWVMNAKGGAVYEFACLTCMGAQKNVFQSFSIPQSSRQDTFHIMPIYQSEFTNASSKQPKATKATNYMYRFIKWST